LEKKKDVIVSPATIHLMYAVKNLRNDIGVSVQTVGNHDEGAFTGSTTAKQARDAGASWAILGHSERRHVFGESNDSIGAKVSRVLDADLSAVVCVGETLGQRDGGTTERVVLEQLEAFAAHIGDRWARVVIAYEPVWAIGTGKVSEPADAQSVHVAIRAFLAKRVSSAVAASTRIIYGGSVKPANCEQLATQPDIDGFLVGGASLKAADFLAIINKSSKQIAKI
jgi:triosephosphate isomerase (TIM)